MFPEEKVETIVKFFSRLCSLAPEKKSSVGLHALHSVVSCAFRYCAQVNINFISEITKSRLYCTCSLQISISLDQRRLGFCFQHSLVGTCTRQAKYRRSRKMLRSAIRGPVSRALQRRVICVRSTGCVQGLLSPRVNSCRRLSATSSSQHPKTEQQPSVVEPTPKV